MSNFDMLNQHRAKLLTKVIPIYKLIAVGLGIPVGGILSNYIGIVVSGEVVFYSTMTYYVGAFYVRLLWINSLRSN